MKKSKLIYAGKYRVYFDMNDSAADSENQKTATCGEFKARKK